MWQQIVDGLRVVVIVMGGTVLCMSLVVMRLYQRHYKKARDSGYKGLLPRHVRTVATGQVIATFYITLSVSLRFGEPATWRIPTGMLAAGFTLFSLVDIARFKAAQGRGEVGTDARNDKGGHVTRR